MRFLFLSVSLALAASAQAELPSDEAGIVALFEKAGARITKDDAGHATKIFSGGKPPHSTAELQLLGKLKHLEQIALNAPRAADDEWEFLHEPPNLKRLTIWHCKTISSLEAFGDLPIEALTVGGCMGIRDLNRESPEKQRDAVLSLKGLPNVTYLNLYHSPLVPDDAHLAHIAEHFPKLEELKVDFAAPRGGETNISPEGLQQLLKLPLRVVSMENAKTFTPAHMRALAKIETLEAVLVDNRRGGVDTATLSAALKAARPDVEVAVADEGASGPPRRSR